MHVCTHTPTDHVPCVQMNEFGDLLNDEMEPAVTVHQYDRVYAVRHNLKELYAPGLEFTVDDPWAPKPQKTDEEAAK